MVARGSVECTTLRLRALPCRLRTAHPGAQPGKHPPKSQLRRKRLSPLRTPLKSDPLRVQPARAHHTVDTKEVHPAERDRHIRVQAPMTAAERHFESLHSHGLHRQDLVILDP